MAVRDAETRADGGVGRGYVVALVGPAGTSAGYVAAHEFVPPGMFAMVLVLSVLGAAVLGGPVPAVGAAAFSLVCLDLFHVPPSGLPRFSLQEIELLGGFLLVAAAAIGLVDRGLRRREQEVRAELRWERLRRILEAVSAGVSAHQLLPMIKQELTAELGLDMVRYEAEPRTTCRYRVGRHGGLFDGGGRVGGPQLRLPDEPIRVHVRFRGDDLGQLVLLPGGRGTVTEDQLLLTANLTEVLAEALHEHTVGSAADSDRRTHPRPGPSA